MTTADPQHVRAGGLGRAWRGFRRWRRTRPFWGGLFTALAGVEMFASTRMTLNGLSFHSGATGLYSLLIPVILLTCGLLLWFSPGQRLFYSIVAAVTTIYSLMGLNLGGFFVGLLLGMVGSALGFAWTPLRSTDGPATAVDAPDDEDRDTAGSDDPTLVDELLPADVPALPHQRGDAPAYEQERPAPAPAGYDAPPAGPRDPRYFAVALVVLGLSATGLVATRPSPVQAAPAIPAPAATTTCPSAPAATPSATPGRSTPTATPSASASPSPTPTRDGGVLGDILRGIGDLFTGGGREEPSASPSASPTPSAKAAAPTAGPTPTGRTSSRTGCAPSRPTRPSRPGQVEPGKLLPRIAPEPGQPKVAQKPSKLTGSSVTMSSLRFEGIVDLPTANGTLKALKFSMSKAVTDDFKLVADGPAGRNQQYVTDRLTVQGDVAFYATRFVGRLLGIKLTLTPDLPFPDGIPVTLPISVTFTDPVIDLAFVDCRTLTARPALTLSLP
ncbi:DUF6114 domain-containing protein [Micromonospora purpureochromogenes]|uniref:Uncharacterized protein n=1 Tax=Micromonospora purpureochromogenes TaxID=47872 RepID=A0ABX2RH63_9ACTN|nr:DUF6114 domain-containing protein [Micromonospora purpureochromogenes]NYF55845.1 hypothetical protein [Micromonospora purpureochromogenes]